MLKDTFRTLPCVGARLVKLRFCGNGKDADVTLEAEGHRKSNIISDSRVELTVLGPMSITMDGWGDNVVWEIAPAAGQAIRIEDAAIGFPSEDEDADEWEETFRRLERGETPYRAVTLRLKLSGSG